MLGLFLLTYLAGAAYECGCVFWVHYAERYRKVPASMWSGFNAAIVTIVGVESFLSSDCLKLAYVLGFMTGTWCAILIKRRMAEQGEAEDLRELARILRLAQITIDGFDDVATLSPRDRQTRELIQRLCLSLPAETVH
jgi:hypothetical protein